MAREDVISSIAPLKSHRRPSLAAPVMFFYTRPTLDGASIAQQIQQLAGNKGVT